MTQMIEENAQTRIREMESEITELRDQLRLALGCAEYWKAELEKSENFISKIGKGE